MICVTLKPVQFLFFQEIETISKEIALAYLLGPLAKNLWYREMGAGGRRGERKVGPREFAVLSFEQYYCVGVGGGNDSGICVDPVLWIQQSK